MNKVIITGNLCRDPEIRRTQSGKAVISNCVAVNRDRKEADGSYSVDFINIVVWDKAAEYLAQYAKKGDKVEIVGRWNVRTYEANGSTHTANECVVESIKAFSSQPKQEQGQKQAAKDTRLAPEPTIFDNDLDDLPF